MSAEQEIAFIRAQIAKLEAEIEALSEAAGERKSKHHHLTKKENDYGRY